MLPNRIEKSPPIEAAAGIAWNAVKMKGYPMNTQQSSNKKKIRRGMALVAAMIFVMVFMAVSVGMMTMSSTNIQSAANHRYANSALNAALSGLEVARYHIQQAPVIETYSNTVSVEEANQMWDNLFDKLHSAKLGGKTEKKNFEGRTEIRTGWVSMNESATPGNAQGVAWAWGLRRRGSASFQLRFSRDEAEPFIVSVHSIGRDSESDDEQTITRTIEMKWLIAKQSAVLEYAVASRGRIWVEQGSIVHGPLFSTWNRPEISAGIQTAADTIVKGTINTAIPLEDLQKHRIQMETLDENNQPVFDEEGNRVHSPKDTIQGQHDGINYDVPYNDDMPGMRPEDYNTREYKEQCDSIDSIGNYNYTVTEYFPYAEGDYTQPKSRSSIKYTRRVYKNRTLNNIRVPQGRHALFKNCTFEGILFIEARSNYSDSASYTNNIRFEDCTFKGVIVTDVPSAPSNYAWWMRNSLTFTGESTFENISSFQEATVLAPNFNVNIGSTAQVGDNSNNIIKGAIVGGIVDVYGDATIHGTIISMYDTSAHSSGYVTNIGDAEDGGSETNGNIEGQIQITPDPEQLLPSGIKSPIVFKVLGNSYTEVPWQRTSED